MNAYYLGSAALGSMRIVENRLMADIITKEVALSWKEQLFDRPFRWFAETKTVTTVVPWKRIMVSGNTIFCHPTVARQIIEAAQGK